MNILLMNLLEKLEEFKITKYNILDDGSVDVFQEVNLSNSNLTEIPIRFNKVFGDFDVGINELTSLVNAPIFVDGYFRCNYNKLTSLEYCPKEITSKILNCSENEITSLKYCPNITTLDCSKNKLENLDFLPHTVRDLNCSYNGIKSLKGCPKKLSSLNANHNKLSSLEGILNNSLSRLDLSFNDISNLESFFPLMLPTSFLNLSFNLIEEFPKYPEDVFRGVLNISNNKLTSFKNMPKYIDGYLLVENNNIFDYSYIPYVSIELRANNNQSQHMIDLKKVNLNDISIEEKLYWISNTDKVYKKFKITQECFSKEEAAELLTAKIDLLNLIKV